MLCSSGLTSEEIEWMFSCHEKVVWTELHLPPMKTRHHPLLSRHLFLKVIFVPSRIRGVFLEILIPLIMLMQ